MERRSNRLKSVLPKSMAEDGGDESDIEMTEPPQAESSKKPRPKKRREVGNSSLATGSKLQLKKPRGKRGLLKDVVGMPMDVLFEIFGQLEPLDLLNLARTTKDIRNILMSRTSISLWKRAFSNVTPSGLPDCPPDLNEPQYADLAFGKTCTFCERKLAVIYVVWGARVRTCSKCIDSNFTESHRLVGLPYTLKELLPTLFVPRPGGWSCGRRRTGRYFVYDPLHENLRQEYSGLNEDEKTTWSQKKHEEWELIRDHSAECKRWAEERQTELENEKATIVEARKAIVLDYIRELGWGEEVDLIPAGVSGPEDDSVIIKLCQREVTQRGLEGITSHLTEYMEEVKSRRIFRERKEVLQKKLVTLKETYTQYLLTLPPTAFYPSTADIFNDTMVKDILEDMSTPDLTIEQTDLLTQIFPELLQTWQEPIKRKLIDIVARDAAPENFSFDPSTVLDIATTTFQCTECYSPMQAKQAIAHRCTRLPLYLYGEASREDELLRAAIKEVTWNSKGCLKFLPKVSKKIEEVLATISLETMTVDALEELDPVFECLSCHSMAGRLTMRWFGLYSHCHGCHFSHSPMKLVVLSLEDAKNVRTRMDEEHERHYYGQNGFNFLCTHCRFAGALLVVLDHVKAMHEVDKPRHEVDLVMSPDVSRHPTTYRLWPPRLREDVEEMVSK